MSAETQWAVSSEPKMVTLTVETQAPTDTALIDQVRYLPPTRSRLWGVLRFGVSPFLVLSDTIGAAAAVLISGIPLAYGFGAWALTVVLLAHRGTYRSRLNKSVLDQLPTLVASPIFATATVTCIQELVSGRSDELRRMLLAGALCALLLLLGRLGCYAIVRKARRAGLVTHRALILGAGEVSREITRCMQERPEFGIRPVAVWDQDPFLAAEEFGVPLVDTPDLAGLIAAASAKVVIIAFGRRRESEMVAVLRTCDRMDCEIFVVPRLFELHMWGSDTDEVWGMPLVRLRRPAYRLPSWQLKPVFDVIVALAMLIPLAPLMAALALAVRLEGGKGVIFRQPRVGLNGKIFNVLKFRSMRPANDEEAAIKWSVSQDSRVGPVGRFLRRTSLDELPQLWNVLRRDMTLVGPRPERPFFVEQFSRQFPRYQARQRVPPGLTGWAQVNGLRGDTSIYDRAAFDNYYIENWSLWLDVKILLRTIVAVLRRDGC